MSMGKVRCTGPGLPDMAVRKAVATNSGMRVRSWISHEPLLTGAAISTWFISWNVAIPFSGNSADPAMNITGLSDV